MPVPIYQESYREIVLKIMEKLKILKKMQIPKQVRDDLRSIQADSDLLSQKLPYHSKKFGGLFHLRVVSTFFKHNKLSLQTVHFAFCHLPDDNHPPAGRLTGMSRQFAYRTNSAQSCVPAGLLKITLLLLRRFLQRGRWSKQPN